MAKGASENEPLVRLVKLQIEQNELIGELLHQLPMHHKTDALIQRFENNQKLLRELYEIIKEGIVAAAITFPLHWPLHQD